MSWLGLNLLQFVWWKGTSVQICHRPVFLAIGKSWGETLLPQEIRFCSAHSVGRRDVVVRLAISTIDYPILRRLEPNSLTFILTNCSNGMLLLLQVAWVFFQVAHPLCFISKNGWYDKCFNFQWKSTREKTYCLRRVAAVSNMWWVSSPLLHL